MTFDIQQWIKDQEDWFTIASHDTLAEAEAELTTLKADPYYSKFEYRIWSDTCPN